MKLNHTKNSLIVVLVLLALPIVISAQTKKPAAIGLILGGAGGAGSVAIKGGKELKLESGTEMLVRVTR